MKPKYIILHHSLTKDSGTVSWNAIRKYHKETLGWNDIGYHVGIELVGDTPEVFLGRPFDKIGAHCRDSGRNMDSIGVCIVGNYDIEKPSNEIVEATINTVSMLCRIFKIPIKNVKGHNEYSFKSCPGQLFPLEMITKRIQV